MKVRSIMTPQVIQIAPGESAAVAARLLTHYNIGALPVCTTDGRLCGMLTDRDVVTRCIASGLDPAKTAVRQIMTGKVQCVTPDMDAGVAAHLMGSQQIRRLPVVEEGKPTRVVRIQEAIAAYEAGYIDAVSKKTYEAMVYALTRIEQRVAGQ